MPKKGKGGKKKGKAKDVFLTDPDACQPFGFMPKDIVVTPMGMEVTIIGVKKSAVEGGTGTMWASFQGGYNSPLRPKSAVQFEEQGYRKAHEGLHILRDKEIFDVRRQELLDAMNPAKIAEEKRKKAEKKAGKKGAKKRK